MRTVKARNENKLSAETLPDRQKFRLDAERWIVFQEALGALPSPAPRLAKLLREPSVFERGGLA